MLRNHLSLTCSRLGKAKANTVSIISLYDMVAVHTGPEKHFRISGNGWTNPTHVNKMSKEKCLQVQEVNNFLRQTSPRQHRLSEICTQKVNRFSSVFSLFLLIIVSLLTLKTQDVGNLNYQRWLMIALKFIYSGYILSLSCIQVLEVSQTTAKDTCSGLCEQEAPKRWWASWKEHRIQGKNKQTQCVCVLSCFSRVWLFVTPWTVAHQAPLSMGFSRQEHWSGLPLPSPGDLSNPGIEPMSLMSPALAVRLFTTSAKVKYNLLLLAC